MIDYEIVGRYEFSARKESWHTDFTRMVKVIFPTDQDISFFIAFSSPGYIYSWHIIHLNLYATFAGGF